VDVDLPIEQLGLNVRTYQILRRTGFTSVSQLLARSESDLFQVRNLGRQALEEIKRKLQVPTMSGQLPVSGWSLGQQKTQAEAYDAFVRIEQHLRRSVYRELRAVYRSEWWQKGIPQTIQQRILKKLPAPVPRDPTPDYLNYIDFGQYKLIILDTDNWLQVFHPKLQNAREVERHLNQLNGIRRIIAHTRPLGPNDIYLLEEESRYANRAFRVRKTKELISGKPAVDEGKLG
jgi:hypothetical protein